MNLRPTTVVAGSVTFADPSNILNTTRIKNGASTILVDGVKVPFARAELISARQVSVPMCDSECTSSTPTSVRIYISGPIGSKGAMIAQFKAAVANMITAIETDDVLSGFPAQSTTAYVVDVPVT